MSSLSLAQISALCVTSASLMSPAEQRRLLDEATRLRPDARTTDRPGWRVVNGRQFLGPALFKYSLDGDAREVMHRALVPRVREIAGIPLRPVQSNYLYYERGDFLGLHHDQARCPYTVIALLDGPAEPLCLHQELIGVPPADLVGLVEPGGHRGGTDVSLDRGALLFAGTVLPHHRVPHQPPAPITIVTFCFTDAPERDSAERDAPG